MHDKEFENLIFLGAGASQAEIDKLGLKGVSVLQRNLLQSYFSTTANGARLDLLSTFFQTFFGIDTSDPNAKYPSFEETLALIELAILRNQTLGTEFNFQPIRTQLVYAIAQTLARNLERVDHKSLHNCLLKRLDNENLLECTAFVSLNYDIIIDNAILMFRGRDEELLFPDYGFYISKEKQRHKFVGQAVPLYKLHGSLNWLFCPVCCSIHHLGTEKIDSELAKEPGYKCDTLGCREVQIPVLIPPTYLKDISNPFLQGAWTRAQKTLKNIKRIFFCGYSLPDADIQVKYFLKTLQMERTTNTKMEVYVASKEPSGTTSSFDNYTRFFGVNVTNNLNMNFQEFVNEMSFANP